MFISLKGSNANGFKRWSDDHQPDNDDDNPSGATPIAAELPADEPNAVAEPVHRPWAVPGVGGSF